MLRTVTLGIFLALLVATGGNRPAPAQETTPAAEAPPATAASLPAEELEALVARVALYPDPLLALVLQASTLPIEVVQAARFLDKRAKDPALQPDPAWDTSVTGLLNYPTVLGLMNDELDWTEALGNAVINQLDDVQAAIQQVRSEIHAAGGLASNDKQKVIVGEQTIKIEPAKPEVIYVPVYQPQPAPVATATTAAAYAEPAPAAAPAPLVESAPAAAPAPYAEPAPAAPTAYAAAPTAYAPAAPVAYAPPAVTYSDPYPSFWTHTAAFAGGAVVGGLLGYAIGEDDDDDIDFDDDDIELDLDDVDWDDIDEDDLDNLRGNRGGINIEDSNVVVAGGNRARVERNNQLAQNELRARRQQRTTTASATQRAQARARVGTQPLGATAARTPERAQARPQTQAARTGGTGAARRTEPARQAQSARTSSQAQPQRRVGEQQAASRGGAFSAQKPATQVRKEAERGARSRTAAQRSAPARPQAQQARPQQARPQQARPQQPQRTAARPAQTTPAAFNPGNRGAERQAARGAQSRGQRQAARGGEARGGGGRLR